MRLPHFSTRFVLPFLALAALSGTLLAAPDVEAFQPSRTPVSPAGVPAACDVPTDQHMRNTGGMGRGGPGTGAGLCVFTSFEVACRWQGIDAMAGFQKWMTKKPGSGNPPKLAAMISQFCREKGVPEPDYVQHTGGDVRFLELAMRTRRVAGVTYAGSDDFYAGPIDHMVDLVHLDPDSACIVDNNRPGVFVWMTRAEFLQRWRARGGGWAVVLLNSPPPPPVIEKREFSRIRLTPLPWFSDYGVQVEEPMTREELLREWRGGDSWCTVKTQQYYQYPNCPNGRCPVVVAAPIAAAGPKVNRSDCSVFVRRDMGRGVSECGTGTVIAAEGGKSLVLTNAHVVTDATRPLSVYLGKKPYPARLIAVSRLNPDEVDLALLTIDAMPVGVAPFAAEAAPVGTAVYLWGYGGKFGDSDPTFKHGVTIAQGNYLGPKTLRTTIPSQEGDSGSGIFDSAGQLVAIGWGGDDYQFCVHLEPARKWVIAHAGEQFPSLTGQKTAPPPHAVPNHGIDREELDQITAGGQHRFWIRGRETTEKGVFDALANGLVDDSDRYFLSVIGDDATKKQLDAWFTDARFAKYRDKLHVKVFPRESWVVRDRLRSLVTLQEPKGNVLGTLDKLEMELLLALLQQVFDPKPPPAPAPNTQPNPAPNAAPNAAPNQQPHADPVPAPASSDDKWKWVLLAAIAVAIFFRRSTSTPTPEK